MSTSGVQFRVPGIGTEFSSSAVSNFNLKQLNFRNLLSLVAQHWILALTTLVVLHLVHNYFRNGLWRIPGPKLAKFSRLWRFKEAYQGQHHVHIIELHRQLGPLVRIGPKHVSIGDPAMIPVIYGLKRGYTKTAFYPLQCISWNKKPQMNLFSERNEDYHKAQMRFFGNSYALSSILELEEKIDTCSMLFIKRLDELCAKGGNGIDLGEWLQYYAFDVVGEVSFAQKLGFLEKGGDVDNMMEAIRGILTYAATIGQIPEFHKILLGNPLFPILFPSMESWNQVLVFTLKAINSRTKIERDGELDAKKYEEKDFLSRWSSVKSSDANKMSTRDIIVHLSTNVFAGSDTTAIALRAIFYYLFKNPDKMAKARAEIDAAYKAGLLSPSVQYKETHTHLPYVSACIKEGTRIFPSVGYMLERHVPAGGLDYKGVHIPEGTVVGINSWVLHHDDSVFYKSDEFVPERWIDSSPDELKKMEKSMFNFGAGTRTCIGKNISLVEMAKIVPTLLLNYDMHYDGEWKTHNSWFVQQSGLVVDMKKRDLSSI